MMYMNWVAQYLAHLTSCPSATLDLVGLGCLGFTSDPGMATESARTAQPTCYQTGSESLPSVCQSLQSSLPSKSKASSCLLSARTLQCPVDVTP